MLKRPKPGESEDDILRMQEEFLREKDQTLSFKPSAQVVNLRRTEHQTTKRLNSNETSTRKPSKFALARGLSNSSEKRPRTEENTNSVMGEILEKNHVAKQCDKQQSEIEDDKVYYPQIIPSVLGNIIEKNVDEVIEFDTFPMPSEGFPVVTRRDKSIKADKKSIYAQQFEKLNKEANVMEVDEPFTSSQMQNSNACKLEKNLPTKSFILSCKDAENIHSENIEILNKMSEKEILDEQQKLLSSLDSKLVEFIKARRKKANNEKQITMMATEIKDQNMTAINEEISNATGMSDHAMNEDESKVYSDGDDTLWENDVLSNPNVSKWLHFESLEKDKLEWMKGIKESANVKPNEPYEARFDFKGYLLPYTMEYTEKTKVLFHHGEEPHRPGYTLTELIELSRSAVVQQRVVALNTIAGIVEYYNVGTYKDIIELPISKIFFIVRIALDENKTIILEPALKAMRNLFCNRIDEASLDGLIGFEEGAYQPCLENDKSEIQELEAKESEIKDFHLAEIDLIAVLLRTDILQRLYYIIETIKPSFNCVQYSLQILTRLCRDSIETAEKIVSMKHLMSAIINYFVPVSSINFIFEPQIIYNGKPILSALKLLRVLSLQSQKIGNILISEYNILKSISEYISSGIDSTYGLRLQIESFCVMSNLMHYGLAIDNALSLGPIIVTTLHKHIQGTDVNIDSSIVSATHAAVVLQFINTLLKCNKHNIDNYKHQIYPLIKEGVLKWLTQVANSERYTCGHLKVISSTLDCCQTILLNDQIPLNFLNESLNMLANSRGCKEMIKNLIPSSNLLSGFENKDFHTTKNLISLGSIVIDSAQKILPILNITSSIPFFVSLFKLLTVINDKDISNCFIEHILMYLRKLANKAPSLPQNWFTRMEIDLVFDVIKVAIQCDIAESKKDLLYAVANKLCYILRADKQCELDFLFNNIIFNEHWFTTERLFNLVSLSENDGFSKALTSIEEIKMCYSKVINLNYTDLQPNIVLRRWQEPILPRDWIYLPILSLYSRSQTVETNPSVVGIHAKKVAEQMAKDKELIISCSLEWILFNEMCFPDLLNEIDETNRFCRIMCVFLCDNSLFLEPKIKVLLRKCIQILFKKAHKFNFDKELVGLNSFQDFYMQFLEQFQAVSYGDPTFAACVFVPLAQRHNIKWRKILWSEYAGCLRALDCPENLLCYEIKNYLYPEETDKSLLKCYFRALNSNLLRPDTIAYKIAKHHVESAQKRAS